MKAVAAKKWLFGLSAALSVSISLLPAVSAYAADQFPFFKEYGADVSTGGWFADSTGSCGGSNYQTGSSGSPLTGGIVTYANTGPGSTANGGSSSQYAVFTTGNIDSAGGSPGSGFYSDGAAAGSNVGGLTFADINNLPWGGNFDGNVVQSSECIPDYYDNAQQTSGIQNESGNVPSFGGLSGQYIFDNGNAVTTINSSAQSLSPGQQLTIFVNGDAYIDGNINYQSTDTTTPPKFALVVRGNVYIDPGVTRLDGWYIAQPPPAGTPTSTDGVIWTCHDGTAVTGSNAIDYSQELGCGNQLTVNGALTAKLLILNRINGNVLTEKAGSGDGSATSDPNAAEVINYTPDMVAGGGFFQKTDTSTSNIESLLSLPPVF